MLSLGLSGGRRGNENEKKMKIVKIRPLPKNQSHKGERDARTIQYHLLFERAMYTVYCIIVYEIFKKQA